jgi:hypothetical protein
VDTNQDVSEDKSGDIYEETHGEINLEHDHDDIIFHKTDSTKPGLKSIIESNVSETTPEIESAVNMNETFYTIIPGEIYLTDESLITDRIASFDEQQLFDLDICQEIEICDIVTQELKEGETNGQSIEEETDCSTDDTLHTSTIFRRRL